jgi:hypothetical protein
MASAQRGLELRRVRVETTSQRREEDPTVLNCGIWEGRVPVCAHARGGLHQSAKLGRGRPRRRTRRDPHQVPAGPHGRLELGRARVDTRRNGIPEHVVTGTPAAPRAGEVKVRHPVAAHAPREGVQLRGGDLPGTGTGPCRVRATTTCRCQHGRPGENGHDHQPPQPSPATAAIASACVHIIAYLTLAAGPAGSRLVPVRSAGPGWLR